MSAATDGATDAATRRLLAIDDCVAAGERFCEDERIRAHLSSVSDTSVGTATTLDSGHGGEVTLSVELPRARTADAISDRLVEELRQKLKALSTERTALSSSATLTNVLGTTYSQTVIGNRFFGTPKMMRLKTRQKRCGSVKERKQGVRLLHLRPGFLVGQHNDWQGLSNNLQAAADRCRSSFFHILP